MKTCALLAALETIVDDKKYISSYFVKPTGNVLVYLIMRKEEGSEYFEVYCNVGNSENIIRDSDRNSGYEDIGGYERHKASEWDIFVSFLQMNGWINRDMYTGDFMKHYITETPEERYTRIKTKTAKAESVYSKISEDASFLLARLQFITDVISKIPSGLDFTLEEVAEKLGSYNDRIMSEMKYKTLSMPFSVFSDQAMTDAKAILEQIKSLDLTENIDSLIKKFLIMLRRFYVILPSSNDMKRSFTLLRNIKDPSDLEDIIKRTGYRLSSAITDNLDDKYSSSNYWSGKPFDPDSIPDLEDIDKYGEASFVVAGDNIIIENADDALKAEILSMMGNDANKYVNGYRVRNLTTEAAYDAAMAACKGARRNEEILWHGSRTENWRSIIENGMLISKARNGMFGVGLYFADKFDKSRGYTSAGGSRHAGGKDPTGFIALFKVRTGKKLPRSNADSDAKDAMLRYKCDSVMGKAGRSLYNNEYIVYNDDQCTIYALVEIK